ncbi:heterokaryon incompatibility protein-domain-containing protein [Xylariomycetidae sp. FL0641]|nr:heterokaryon incompatibility protein-domain-containing protein [Xylariomycetidae sp. FL0641]
MTTDDYLVKMDSRSVSLDILNLQARNSAAGPHLTRLELYRHLPVSEATRSIRLLELDAAAVGSPSAEDEPPLTGTLRVVSLEDSPQFTALSYVWGGYSAPQKDVLSVLTADGKLANIEITVNCRDALRALRRRYGATRIWIDAICINQADEAEKASQIQHMKEIYSWAEMVYVWLGPGTEQSDHMFRWLEEASAHVFLPKGNRAATLLSLVYHLLRQLWRSAWTMQLVICDLWASLLGLPTFRPLGLKHMIVEVTRTCYAIPSRPLPVSAHPMLLIPDASDFLDRRWFTRGWTFQEIILAWDVTILCGTQALKWDTLVRGVASLRRECYRDWDYALLEPKRKHGRKLLQALDMVSQRREEMMIRDLEQLIHIWMQTHRPSTTGNEIKRRRDMSTLALVENYGLRRQNHESLAWYAILSIFWVIFTLQQAIQVLANMLWAPIVAGVFIWRHRCVFFHGPYSEACSGPWYYPTWNWAAWLVLLGCFIVYRLVYPVIRSTRIALANDPTVGQTAFWDVLQYRLGVVFLREEQAQPPTKQPLQGVIRALRQRETQDPKDRVFATHAVLARLGFNPARPDYSKSLAFVYQAHFEALLRWDPGLINLIIDVNGFPPAGAPSWVPDWSTAAEKNWIGPPRPYDKDVRLASKCISPAIAIEDGKLTMRGQYLAICQYSTGSFPNFEFEDEERRRLSSNPREARRLAVVAMTFAKFLRHAESRLPKIPVYQERMDLLELLLIKLLRMDYSSAEVPQFIDASESSRGNMRRALDTLLSPSLIRGSKILGTWYSRVWAIPAAVLDRFEEAAPSDDGNDDLTENVFLDEAPDTVDNLAVREVTAVFSNLLAGRRGLFITEEGHWGSGPEAMRKDDFICWLPNVSVPMVLRPLLQAEEAAETSCHFTVVGPALIYGFETLDKFDEARLESFTLH